MLVESVAGLIGDAGDGTVHHPGGGDAPRSGPSWNGPSWNGPFRNGSRRDAADAGRRGDVLLGRQAECDALDRLVSAVRGGERRSLLIRGEAGAGKTALLRYVRDGATGCRVVMAAGAESESELTFSGLHQLCAPFLDGLDRLPEPRRQALGTVFGLSTGAPPDRFLVGLAVLSLLADAATKGPLICLIDDAQWLDPISARTVAFVARRLPAERIGLLLAVRERHLDHELTGLERLDVGPLSNGDARALLDSVTPGRLDDRVRDRIVAETRGNPLALLELPRALTPAELAGGFSRPDARPPAGQAEQRLLRRIHVLPAETRHLLLIAAAEPLGDVSLLARAAELLGIRTAAAAPPAEAAGLITIGTRVRFRHPLARTAAYRAAAPEDRRRAHRALAEATDARSDPDRRAWHLANATDGPDETVAAELERTAERARARGGAAAAAAFLERAAQLTPGAGRRGARMLAAARASHRAGGYDTAFELLDAAELSPLAERELALGALLRAQVTVAATGAGTAVPLLLEAARRLEPLDAGLAQEAYRDAFNAAPTLDRLPDIARAVLAAPPGPPPERNRLLLHGLATMISEGYGSGAPMVRQALGAFCGEDPSSEEDLGWLLLASRTALHVWDFPTSTALSTRLVNLSRETGALSVLPAALLRLASNQVLAGELAHAATLIAEARAAGEATGGELLAPYASLAIEPWRGGEAATLTAIADLRRRQGDGAPSSVPWAGAVLHNGLGRYEEAYAAATLGAANPQEPWPATTCLAELVEAASRTGRSARAAEAARRFDEMAQAGGTDWALGTSALLRAQVSGGPAADALYREAIERLGRTPVLLAHARSRLLYGEWLRRQSRRADAREQLSRAYEMLNGAGAASFAERARRELHATGEKARKLPADAPAALTPQESQIAHLASEGLTNPEIGAQLFISPHTVEWHLRKVFAKLGIASRKQISITLLDATAATSWRRTVRS